MKKTILLFSFLVFIGFVEMMGQEATSKIHKVGVNFSNPDNFGVRYYTGRNKTLWRFTALNGYAGLHNTMVSDSINTKHKSFNVGASIGLQKSKPLSNKMDFFYGLDFLNYFNFYKYAGKSWNINSGLGVVFGLTYKLNDEFDISVELEPSFR